VKPINEYVKSPNLDTGGALVTVTGPPGCGKTNTLTQLGIERFNEDHKVIWRATEQAQWASFLANDIPVILWKDESIQSVDAWVSNADGTEDKISIQEKVEDVKSFSDADEVVDNASKNAINVVMVPGLIGDTHEKYYFRKTWIELLKALVNRRNVAEPYSFFTDEGGDIWPCQQQLRKPFYKLVVEDTPPLLAQLRKQLVFMYIAAHSTHDLHYFVWKIKGNTIGYMSNSNVKRDIHSEVNQSKVNTLDRGEMVVPPKDRAQWMLAYEMEDLDWVGQGSKFRNSWDADIPNLLEDDEDKEVEINNIDQIPKEYRSTIEKDVKKEWIQYMIDELEMSYREITDVPSLPNSTATISNWAS